MSKYNFDAVIERRGTNSLKYDYMREMGKPVDVLPMWVADMDFSAPIEIIDDINKAIAHGIFGYTVPKDEYNEAVAGWFYSRYGYKAENRDIIKAPGVVFALVQAVRALTEPGDAVIIQTPVYYPFYDIIRNNGRELVQNPLICENGVYSIDFVDFERKIAENNVKLFILCSPHNPIGRVWTRGELERLLGICASHGVIVVSDEIHCDFVWPGYEHTCFGLLDDNAIIVTAPSKTFNLAGIQISNIFVKNSDLREKLKAEIGKTGIAQLSMVSFVACQSAYTKGGEWLDELKTYLLGNIRFLSEFLTERLPRIRFVPPEGTYLMWLDFSDYGLTQDELDRHITQEAKLWLSTGTMFGADGEGFQRMNIACRRDTLEEALDRLERSMKSR